MRKPRATELEFWLKLLKRKPLCLSILEIIAILRERIWGRSEKGGKKSLYSKNNSINDSDFILLSFSTKAICRLPYRTKQNAHLRRIYANTISQQVKMIYSSVSKYKMTSLQ